MFFKFKARLAAAGNSRIFFKALTILLILVSLLISCTKDSNPTADTASERNAICGYDPVAYFEESKPVPGINNYSYVWNHAKWNFSSEENMELFKKDPEKYAPKYNGYCAFALSRNDFVEADPEAWSIINDKLYLTFNQEIKNAWLRDKRNYIAQADRNWHLRIEK